ncbi:MAG: ATP-binding protein [Proteobacteria bacterium]|nr:ATP-binding protein [Pseudomonadota bacterium]
MSINVTLSVPSDPKYLCTLRGSVENVLRSVEISDVERSRVILALDEAATNVIRHSCGCNPDFNVELSIKATDKELIIELKDFGDCGTDFDLNKKRTKNIKNVTPGGFGVGIIKKVMDSVEFTSSPEKGNLLRMRKNIG